MDTTAIAVRGPSDLTMQDKLFILRDSFKNHFTQLELKFSAFVAAVQSENYIKCLTTVPDAFVTQTGEIDIDGLRDLIMRVPSFIFRNELLEHNLSMFINKDVIELIFWVEISTPHLFEESVDNFMTVLLEREANEMPVAIFEVMNIRDAILKSESSRKFNAPKIGYYHIKFDEFFNFLVNGVRMKTGEPFLLNKYLEPDFNTYTGIWKNVLCVRPPFCIAMYYVLPDSSNDEVLITTTGTYMKVFDDDFAFLKYVFVYDESIGKLESVWTVCSKNKQFLLQWVSIAAFGSLCLIKSNFLHKIYQVMLKYIPSVAEGIETFVQKIANKAIIGERH